MFTYSVPDFWLGMLLLSNMSFHILEATGIFILWFAQFIRPDLHTPVTLVYLAWSSVEIIMILAVRRRVAAVAALVEMWRGRRPPGCGAASAAINPRPEIRSS